MLRRMLACLLFVPFTVAGAPTGTAAQIIHELRMQKIPQEGAWFAGTYRSTDALPANAIARYQDAPRVLGSAIYALVTREDFSAMHRLETDEIWHYYAGEPLELLLLHPDGRGEVVVLGPDVLKGQRPQVLVPRGVWQGGRPLGRSADAYTLFGCTLVPGFEYSDFSMGYRDELVGDFPQFKQQIVELTRAEFVTRPTVSAEPRDERLPGHDTFVSGDIPGIDVAAGIELRELAGRDARIRTAAYSIAQFTLMPGKSMPTSFNKTSEEVFVVTSGSGEVVLEGKAQPVSAGGVVLMKPGVKHSIRSSQASPLTFYAISSPAFSPDDYVLPR